MYSEANGYVDDDTDNGKNLTVKPAEHLEPKFKALKGNGGLSSGKDEEKLLLQTSSLNYGGYQAGETSQMPPTLFPGSLASYVLVFQMDEEWHDASLYPRKDPDSKKKVEISYGKQNMQPLVDKLRSSDMIVREMYSSEQLDGEGNMPYMFAFVSIGEKRQMTVAEVMGEHNLIRVRMRKMDDIGNEIKNGGAWTSFVQHLAPYFEKSSEGTLFSSAQQQQIMEFMMHDTDERAMGPQLLQKESCEAGNNVLQQLVWDQRIVAYFPLHHAAKRKWLKQHWADSFFTRQPIEDIREYFGEEIALFFVWFGYLCTMLWIPAFMGLWVLSMQGIALESSGSVDNPYNPLYAIFIAVWAIMFAGGFKRLTLVYQHEWDTVDFEPVKPDRRDFVQCPNTYKTLNTINKKEEYYPDPLLRILWLVASTVVCTIMVIVNMVLVLMVKVVMNMLIQLLGLPHVGILFGAIVQGLLIYGLRQVGAIVFRFLNDKENWKDHNQYARAFYSKMFAFGFINSYFALFFFSFISNDFTFFGLLTLDVSCPDNDCINYVGLMTVVIFIEGCILHYLPSIIPFVTKCFTKEPVEPPPMEVYDEDSACTCTKCVPRLLNDDEKAAEEAFALNSFASELTKEKDKNEKEKGALGQQLLTLDDFYFSNIMELGYLLLFGATCPLLPMLLLIFNMLELRSAAGEFLFSFQRARYVCAKDIGFWEIVIDILVVMAILTQTSYCAFISNGLYYYFPYMTQVDKTFYAVIIEHVLLFFKILYDGATAHVPGDVSLAYKVRNHELKISLDHFDTKDDDNVKFYTDEEGFPYYGN